MLCHHVPKPACTFTSSSCKQQIYGLLIPGTSKAQTKKEGLFFHNDIVEMQTGVTVTEQDGQWNSRRCTNLSAQANIQSTCVDSDLQVFKKTTLAHYFLISAFGYVRVCSGVFGYVRVCSQPPSTLFQ
jgi:hypothetical protein